MRGNSGFSLYELLTVIAIMAIAAAIAVPNMIGWRNRMKLGDGARAIYSALQLARSEAARNNSAVTVSFAPNGSLGDEFAVFVDDGAGIDADSDGVIDNADNGVLDSNEKIYLEAKLPSGVTFDSSTFSSDDVIFRSNGLPDGGGTVVITNISGDSRQIIMSTAGRIRIED